MKFFKIFVTVLWIFVIAKAGFASQAIDLPGENHVDKLTAAGTLLHTFDNFLFNIVARLLAGLSVLAAAWNLKEQRFAMAIICIFGAIMMATVPLWVDNIFSMTNKTAIFSK